jgi:hypothetical protein
VHIYHLLALDTTDIIMCGHSNEKTTMMNALVKEAKDTVLEKLLKGTNEDSDDEEDAITAIAEDLLNASSDPELQASHAKPSTKAKGKSKSKGKSAVAFVDEESVTLSAKGGVKPAGSSSQSSTEKTAMEVDSPMAQIINKPVTVDSQQQSPTTGEGNAKQPLSSKAAGKRKAAEVESEDDGEDKSKEGTSALAPPSKKAKKSNARNSRASTAKATKGTTSNKGTTATKGATATKGSTAPMGTKTTKATKPGSRMMQEGAAWAEKRKAAGAASSGMTVVPSTPTPVPRPKTTKTTKATKPGSRMMQLGAAWAEERKAAAAASSGMTVVPSTPTPAPGTSFFFIFHPNKSLIQMIYFRCGYPSPSSAFDDDLSTSRSYCRTFREAVIPSITKHNSCTFFCHACCCYFSSVASHHPAAFWVDPSPHAIVSSAGHVCEPSAKSSSSLWFADEGCCGVAHADAASQVDPRS